MGRRRRIPAPRPAENARGFSHGPWKRYIRRVMYCTVLHVRASPAGLAQRPNARSFSAHKATIICGQREVLTSCAFGPLLQKYHIPPDGWNLSQMMRLKLHLLVVRGLCIFMWFGPTPTVWTPYYCQKPTIAFVLGGGCERYFQVVVIGVLRGRWGWFF